MFDTVWKIQVDADRWTERDRQNVKIIHEDRKRERCTEITYRVKKEDCHIETEKKYNKGAEIVYRDTEKDYLRIQKEKQKEEEKLHRDKERWMLY
jgi:hypothetical protein